MRHTFNTTKELFDGLNYSESVYFFQGHSLEEMTSHSHLFRIARKKCGLKGVYAIDRNPGKPLAEKSIIPVVYVCEAASNKEAVEIHRLVWNQNSVPFVLVTTPSAIRLYPGFKFDAAKHERGADQHLLEIAKSANDVLEKLSDFTAESINTRGVWGKWRQHVTPDTRVDRNLLKNLKELGDRLKESGGLPRPLAHSLIGKYVYFHYMKDRGILSDGKLNQWGIELGSVFGRDATVSGFQALVKKLDQWLNGSVFPIAAKRASLLKNNHIQQVASTFLGDDPGSGQMHLDFRAYNFEHIPIETLSMVYQQFLHSEKKGRKQGAYYTPVHLVNFMLEELDSKRKFQKGMTAFDPACGSGAFIVQCFRRLIERELLKKDVSKLKPWELRTLLTDHIFGLDMDEDACRVTELSLVITLLDYVDPLDLEKAERGNFKLPALRGKNIFFCKNGFFDDGSKQMGVLSGMTFDWIVGNPPWNTLSKKSEEPADQSALAWIENNRNAYPVNNGQIAEAFAWKASLHLSDDGVAAFLLPGMTLFKSQGNARKFRELFFSKMNVWSVVNFANIRRLLFEGASSPAAAFFYESSRSRSKPSGFIRAYAPFAMNQTPDPGEFGKGEKNKRIWTLFVNADDIAEIPRRDVVSGDSFPWKMAMWGTERDRHLLVSLQKTFVSLSDFATSHGLEIFEGLQLRKATAKEEIEAIPELAGKNRLMMNALRKCGRIVSFPKEALEPVPSSEAHVRKGRGENPLKICRPPHVIVDGVRRFSVYSDQFIVVPPRQIGISGPGSKKNLLKALALYLGSDVALYQQCLSSHSWGVERGVLSQADLLSLPVPLDRLSPEEIDEWAKCHDELVKKSFGGMTKRSSLKSDETSAAWAPLIEEANEKVATLLGLDGNERCLVDDFVKIRMKLNDGAIPGEALEKASESEITAYSKILKRELDDFLDGDVRDQHQVTARFSSSMVLLSIEHPEKSSPNPVVALEASDFQLREELRRLEKNLTVSQGQWIYFRKNLKLFDGRTTYFVKSRQRLGWLQSQALVDADEFIAEKLTMAGSD